MTRMKAISIFAIFLAIVGWWAILFMTGEARPEEPGALFLFFLLLLATLTATLVPVTAFLNYRFAPKIVVRAPFRFLRHSLLAGLCLTSWAWLQMHRTFSLVFAFVIVLIFVTIEILILRSRNEM